MALDPFLLAEECPTSILSEMSAKALSKGFAIACWEQNALLLVRSRGDVGPATRTMAGFTPDRPNRGQVHQWLANLGLVAVASELNHDSGQLQAPARFPLRGGSVGSTSLVGGPDAWTVQKVVAVESALDRVDALQRHLLEAKFYSSRVGRESAVFPPAHSYTAVTGELSIVTQFVPSYTLGELFVQRRLDGTTSRAVILRCFELASKHLWTQAPLVLESESYADKATRRMALLLEKSSSRVIHTLYNRGARILGLSCRSLKDQLQVCQASPIVRALLYPKVLTLCHGDFIPEDILCSDKEEITFIDPNPQNGDLLTDVAKFVMSLLTAYDLALRDWISVESSFEGQELVLQFGVSKAWEDVALNQRELGEWVAATASTWFEHDEYLKARAKPAAIMLLAGLQSICISTFHAVHHRKPVRAAYFLVAGQLLTETALQTLGY